jgi:hypothetical protein
VTSTVEKTTEVVLHDVRTRTTAIALDRLDALSSALHGRYSV